MTLDEPRAHALTGGEPARTSGRQQRYQNLINQPLTNQPLTNQPLINQFRVR